MEIPSKISIDTQISFTVPPVPDFPPFVMPEIKLPPIDINFPPLVFTTPTYIPASGTPLYPPPQISVTWPKIDFGAPPQISCVCFVQSPGTTDQEFLALKENNGVKPTTEEKCKVILQKIVELANEGKPIGFEQDFGGWTATITKGKMHTHVGVPGKDGNFDILVNNLYDLLIKGQGLSWA